jgi:microcin C transport system substrate-binding protein
MTGYKNISKEIVREEIPHRIPQGIQGFFFNIRKPKFRDWRIRKAIAYAFDFEWENKYLFYNQYKRSESFFTNSPYAYGKFRLPKAGDSYKIRPHLRAAMKLLKSAGAYLKDGKLHLKNGSQLKFTILLVSKGFVKVVLPFKKNLARLGIDVDIRLLDVSQYIRKLKNFDFDMVVASRRYPNILGKEQRELWGSESANIKGSLNIIGIQDKEVDFWIEKIENAKTLEELRSSAKMLDKRLLEQFYVIPHWYIDYFRVAYWKRLHHVSALPKYDLDFFGWWYE